MIQRTLFLFSILSGSLAMNACSESNEPSGDGDPSDDGDAGGAGGAAPGSGPRGYVLMSIVIDAENNRTSYAQVVKSLADGPFDVKSAIEIPGNAEFLAEGDHFYIGAQEEPTWTKYTVDDNLKITKGKVLSLSNFTSLGVGYAHTLVDAETAFTVVTDQGVGVFWDPSTMKIKGEIDLSDMVVEDYSWEAWSTSSYEGRIYVPGRYANWDTNEVRDGVRLAIIDAESRKLVGIAADDRCASGGMPVFDSDGYAYVMGDGRNYIKQMVANAQGKEPPENCLLRIAPGETDFEEDYYFSIPSLTGGLETITELGTAVQGSGWAVAKMFYPEELPDGVEAIDYGFWFESVFKYWRIELGANPKAEEVNGAPFASIGFTGVAANGLYYGGESPDGVDSVIYEIDPQANRAKKRFELAGNFSQLHVLK